VCANTESRTSAGRRTYGGSIHIKNSERGHGYKRNLADLRHAKALAREEVSGNRNCEALECILYGASNQVTYIKTGHHRSGLFLIGHLLFTKEINN